MSMVEPESLPPEPPPLADPGGVPMPSMPPADLSMLAGGSNEAALYGQGGGIPPGVNIDQVSREAAKIQRDKAAATEKVNAENQSLLAKDRARLQKQYEASGIGPDELKPWDTEKAREKYKYDPVEAFGSIGSVFAIVASAFTNRPMENAMFGAAAAMNAIKEGNATEHERAYKAWQDNTKLAISRQKIQSDQFTNAVTLFNTDMTLGKERASLTAAQYGDKQMALLLDNGLYKEAIDLNAKRQDMALKLAETLPKIAIENYKVNDLISNGYNPKEANTPESQRALQKWQQTWNGRKYDEDADFANKWWTENPQGTSEEFSVAYGEWVKRTSKLTGGSVRQPKPEEEAVRDIAAKLVAEAKAKGETLSQGDALTAATKQYRLTTATPTGNRLDDMDQTINQMGNAKTAAQKNLDFLEKYSFGAGLGGRATRLGERVGNVFGSDQTARVDFEKNVAYMKMIAPRLITMSSGRPLAAEAANVGAVIAGLGWGDTTANTIAAMKSFDALMTKMQADVQARRKGTPNAPGTASPAPTGSKVAPWANDPVAK